tara:strand:- start:263 stop:736 length:474 start_codon:yes stop_codon:yes gene_type:complete
MLKKIYLIIFISFLVQSCDYKPIYSNNDQFNFTITDLELSGDKVLNNYLEKKLVKLSKTNTDKEYKIFINSSYSKSSIAKNKSGNTTDYKLTLNLSLKLTQLKTSKNELKEEEVSFNENFIITKSDNTFEQTNYENLIKNNLAEILSNKLIIFLKTK